MIARPSDRLYRAVFALWFVTLGAAGALGIHEVITPDPKPIIRTIVLDVPPACSDAIDAARDERAYTETEQQHANLADERATELADAALSLNPDTIEDAAEALDTERRLVQQAQLDRAEASTRFDDAAGDCLPGVDR